MITFNQLVDVLDWYLISMSMANLMKKINWNNRSVELSENSGAIRNYFDIHSEVKIMEIATLGRQMLLSDIAVFTHDYCFQYWMPQKIGPRTLICCNMVFVLKVIANYRAQLSWYIIRIWIHKKLKTNLLSYTVRKPNQYWNIF